MDKHRLKPIYSLPLLLPLLLHPIEAQNRAQDRAQIRAPMQAQTANCAQTTVVSSASAGLPERNAVAVLVEEAAKRTGQTWATASSLAQGQGKGCLLIAATQAEMGTLLPPVLERVRRNTPDKPESFSLHTFVWHSRQTVVIEGSDARGVLYGIGALLRALELSPGKAILTRQLHLSQSPAKAIRGHQLGYRAKNNTYDAWTLAQFEQYIRELALFGANTIQLISPESDDAQSSPLFPAPALDTLLGISRILDRYGLDCSIYYPEMEQDYSRPADQTRELARFEQLFRQIPRVDSVWIPGGDPGHTPPKLLFPLVEKEAAILHRYHPKATIYLSAQGMSAEHFEDFYQLLAEKPAWLSGVFFGPQSRDSFETQRRRIPAQYPLLFYPDIGHAMHAQFPVPDWDPVFALTEGREPINPRPVDLGHIYQHFAALHAGSITYSEGVNDDVNKFLWTSWDWNPAEPAEAILEEYSRFFLGPRLAKPFAQALADLEKDWRGPLLANTRIPATLAELEQMAASTQALRDNWRFELAQERAWYDVLLQARLAQQTGQQRQAIQSLKSWLEASAGNGHAIPSIGSAEAMRQAAGLLNPANAPDAGAAARQRVFAIADALFHHIGIQLGTKLYGASNWERGANLDRIDIPLNDRVWILAQFDRIAKLPTEPERVAALGEIANWDAPQPGALHDDLGNPWLEPHLLPGLGFAADPELYRTAINGVADNTPLDGWRWSQLSYAETLYETPLTLAYAGLDPKRLYRLRVTFAGEGYTAPIGIAVNPGTAAEQVIEPQHNRKTNPETQEFALPAATTQSGALTVTFTRPTGTGGSGRGHQVAEVWLIPEKQ